MHPYIARSLMDARVADLHRAAAATSQARQARRAARRARPQSAPALPIAPPARESLPVADRVLTH